MLVKLLDLDLVVGVRKVKLVAESNFRRRQIKYGDLGSTYISPASKSASTRAILNNYVRGGTLVEEGASDL